MADSPADQELADRYTAYLGVCNAYAFDRLGEFMRTLELAVDAWRDGLIAEVWSVTDRLDVLDQLRR